MNRRLLSSGILLLILVGVGVYFLMSKEEEPGYEGQVTSNDKIGGVNFVSPLRQTDKDVIAPLKRINANWVAFTPFGYMTPGDPAVNYPTSRNWWGGRPEGIRFLTEKARANGLQVMLKPHVWVEEQGWPGEYEPGEGSWPEWEENYTRFVLELAQVAEELDIEIYGIGTEFKHAVQERPEFWSELIRKVRKVYSGKLIYASNWDNYQEVPFWGELDYIGVDAYHPLVAEVTPSPDSLQIMWQDVAEELESFSRSFDKQIIFTEYGYRSTDQTAWRQWKIENRPPDEAVNLQAQVNAYSAVYDAIWTKQWFAGGFLWKWWPDDAISGGELHSDYTPQHKPVEKVIHQWYSKSRSNS